MLLHFMGPGVVKIGDELIRGWNAQTVKQRLEAIKAIKPEVAQLEDVTITFDEGGDRGSYIENSTLFQYAKAEIKGQDGKMHVFDGKGDEALQKEEKESFASFVKRVVVFVKELKELL